MKNFKPFLLAIVMLLSAATNVNAQQHLKFMGIPLTGTIDQKLLRLNVLTRTSSKMKMYDNLYVFNALLKI